MPHEGDLRWGEDIGCGDEVAEGALLGEGLGFSPFSLHPSSFPALFHPKPVEQRAPGLLLTGIGFALRKPTGVVPADVSNTPAAACSS